MRSCFYFEIPLATEGDEEVCENFDKLACETVLFTRKNTATGSLQMNSDLKDMEGGRRKGEQLNKSNDTGPNMP